MDCSVHESYQQSLYMAAHARYQESPKSLNAGYQFSAAAIFVGLAIVSGASRHDGDRKSQQAVPSRFPKLLRKDISAAFRLFDTMFSCLLVLLFLTYVVYELTQTSKAL